jgi:hypothetical protein
MLERIEKGTLVEVFTTNGGRVTGTLYESYTESYGVTLCELPRPIGAERISRVRKLSPYEVEERVRLREKIANDTYTDEAGCLRWNMGNAVPSWIFEEAGIEMTATQRAAYEADVERVIEGYRAAQAARTPEEVEEAHAEARAAFGPGETVVNILTGERYVT